MDLNKTHKIWTDFTSKYNLELNDIDQHLIFVPNKKQTYSAIEFYEDFKIYFKYVFFKLDFIDGGNEFRIVIPVETKLDICISNPNILLKTFKDKKVSYSNNSVVLESNIENELVLLFKDFKDLKINLTEIKVNTDLQITNSTKILELITKQLPQDIGQIEKLRDLIIKISNELKIKKIIRPAGNITL